MGGLTLKPILGCNLHCTGCYEGEIFRRNGNRPEPYGIDQIIASMARHRPGQGVTLHGGEINLMPILDLERLCEAAKEQGRSIAMQTNGTLVRQAHLDLFAKYAVSVGVSLNGPDRLNRDRRAGNSNEATDRMTARILTNIRQMRDRDIPVQIITVLSQTNAGDSETLTRLIAWAVDLGETLGIWDFRFNPLHADDASASEVELGNEDLAVAWKALAIAAFEDSRRAWLPFREMSDNLLGLGISPCWMTPCDPYATDAVFTILHDGSVGNCLRTAKDGIAYLRTEPVTDTRSAILAQVPMDEGGCGGCKWWRVCYGGCPAEGEGGDWRNRSRFCGALQQTYALMERRLKGMLPNLVLVTSWTTNDEARLLRLRLNRKPDVTAVRAMNPDWSQYPSSWLSTAFERKAS